jgi:hypothetical protein
MEIKKLVTYFKAQSLWPRFWEKENSKNDNGIPWHLSIIAGLTRYGCTLQEAWTMPESEAVWLYIAHCKAKGAKIDLVTEFEWEAMQKYLKENPNTKNNVR